MTKPRAARWPQAAIGAAIAAAVLAACADGSNSTAGAAGDIRSPEAWSGALRPPWWFLLALFGLAGLIKHGHHWVQQIRGTVDQRETRRQAKAAAKLRQRKIRYCMHLVVGPPRTVLDLGHEPVKSEKGRRATDRYFHVAGALPGGNERQCAICSVDNARHLGERNLEPYGVNWDGPLAREMGQPGDEMRNSNPRVGYSYTANYKRLEADIFDANRFIELIEGGIKPRRWWRCNEPDRIREGRGYR